MPTVPLSSGGGARQRLVWEGGEERGNTRGHPGSLRGIPATLLVWAVARGRSRRPHVAVVSHRPLGRDHYHYHHHHPKENEGEKVCPPQAHYSPPSIITLDKQRKEHAQRHTLGDESKSGPWLVNDRVESVHPSPNYDAIMLTRQK